MRHIKFKYNKENFTKRESLKSIKGVRGGKSTIIRCKTMFLNNARELYKSTAAHDYACREKAKVCFSDEMYFKKSHS